MDIETRGIIQADLRLCCSHTAKAGFLMTWLNYESGDVLFSFQIEINNNYMWVMNQTVLVPKPIIYARSVTYQQIHSLAVISSYCYQVITFNILNDFKKAQFLNDCISETLAEETNFAYRKAARSLWYDVHLEEKMHCYSRNFDVKGFNKNLEMAQFYGVSLIKSIQTSCCDLTGLKTCKTFEPGHEEMCLMPYANNKGADQPAHPRILISAFIFRCQDRIIPLVCISEISRFWLVSVAEQVSLCLAWSETPEHPFCHDEAHLHLT